MKTKFAIGLLLLILFISGCKKENEYDISKPPYEFGTNIETVIETEGEPYIPEEDPYTYTYTYPNNSKKLLGYDCGDGWITYSTNDKKQIIKIKATFSNPLTLETPFDVQKLYNSMVEVLDKKCDKISDGFCYHTKDKKTEIIIKADSKNWTNMTITYRPIEEE
jgi:hypothetical protein